MAIMTVWDATIPWAALGANPVSPSELQPLIQEPDSVLLGTRPMMTTYGYWADNQALGFDIAQYDYIGMVIDYGSIAITEDATYEFDIDSDDYGELWVDGTLVSYEIGGVCTVVPIALVAGSYSIVFKFQNGIGPFSFAIRWRKQGDVDYIPLDNTSIGLPLANQSNTLPIMKQEFPFVDYPHKLTVKTQLDGEAVRRRVEIRNRASSAYVASMVTDIGGVAEFKRLPPQSIDEQHYIMCFDDRDSEYLNALIFDRIYQVTDQGFPPEN